MAYPAELADFVDAPPRGLVDAGSVNDDPTGGSYASVGDRIEGIRTCLESRMGTLRFQKLYRSLESGVGEDQKGEIDDGSDVALVAKLVACENGYYS